MAQKSSISVVIVDDNKSIREVLGLLIGSEPGLELVGTAANGQEALEACKALHPDVVLMDLSMPVMNGVDAILAIRAAGLQVKVILLTNTDPTSAKNAMQDAKPDAWLPKDLSMNEVLATIRKVMGNTDD